MKEEKISVIVPAYNAANTIETCLKSILGGTYNNIEILVINDGSTDETKEIVLRICKNDSRVILLNQENHGVGYAKSIGVKASTGTYIAFCDSDDWYDKNYLQEHYRYITMYHADISQCRTWSTNTKDSGNSDDIKVLENDLVRKYLQYESINVTLWDKLYKRTLLDVEGIENNFRYAEDLFMNYVATKNCSKVVMFNTVKYNWYFNNESLSRRKFDPLRLENDMKSWGEIIDDCKILYPELEETARLSSILWICGTYRTMVNSYFHNRQLEKKIRDYIHQDSTKKVLRAEKNKVNKAFVYVTLLSMPIARYSWYVLKGIKHSIKKLIK